MRFPFHMFSDVPKFDFIGYRKAGFLLTGLGVVASIVSIAVHGFNFGIDFTGGVVMEVRTEQAADIGKMRQLLNTSETADASLQAVGSDGNQVLIRIKPHGEENQNQ